MSNLSHFVYLMAIYQDLVTLTNQTKRFNELFADQPGLIEKQVVTNERGVNVFSVTATEPLPWEKLDSLLNMVWGEPKVSMISFQSNCPEREPLKIVGATLIPPQPCHAYSIALRLNYNWLERRQKRPDALTDRVLAAIGYRDLMNFTSGLYYSEDLLVFHIQRGEPIGPDFKNAVKAALLGEKVTILATFES